MVVEYSEQPETVRPRMAPGDVEQLLIHALRHPRVWSFARGQLKKEFFSAEPHLGLLWEIYQPLVDRYGFDAVPESAVHSSFARGLAGSLVPDELADEVLRVPGGFLTHLFDEVKPETLNELYGLDLLKQFLYERDVVDNVRRIVQIAGDDVPERMMNVIERLQTRQSKIASIGQSIVHPVIPDEFEACAVDTYPTGLPFFDVSLGGGNGRGELNAILAPYGSGKTTMVVQIAVNVALYFLQRARLGEPLQHVYIFSYEERPRDVRNRIISYAADILKSELDTEINSVNDMSRRGKLKPYERELFQTRGAKNLAEVDGEFERYMALRQTIDQNLHIINMTGDDGNGAGTGGVSEIAAVLKMETMLGRTPGLVMIDYADELVTRYCESQGLRLKDNLRLVMKSQMKELRFKVAQPFNVPVWVAKQYSGESQQRRATTVMQMADAGECKSFGENFWFVFLFGSVDPETGVMQMAVGKARRAGTQGKVHLVQLQGAFARVKDVSREYTVDPVLGKIVSNEQLKGLQIVASGKEKLKPPRAGNVYGSGFGYKRGTGEPA